MSNSSIWPIDRTLSDATTQGQSGPRSNGNEGVLHISQGSRTGASPSGSLMSYPGHSLGGGLTPLQGSNWCILLPQLTGLRLFNIISKTLVRRVLPLCRDAVSVFYSHSRQGWDCLMPYPGHTLGESYPSAEM